MTLPEDHVSGAPLLVVASGSSAAMLLPAYLVHLKQAVGSELTVLMTETAERFVQPDAIRWIARQVFTRDTPRLNPIELTLTSRAIVVLPASANTLACAALGLAPTPATALLTAPSPCLFFPQMNRVMWDKSIVRRHVEALRSAGHRVVEPELAEVYEIWRGRSGLGLAMPSAEEAAAITRRWLDERDPTEAAASA
jgi:phosphopantothenoylcysteine decarboxylase/phosphopantothenate--cysteine ligase